MKTLKLKKPDVDTNQDTAPTVAAPAEPAKPENNIFVSGRHANPLANAGATAVKKENWTWAAVLSIISFVLFLVLVIALYMEMSELKFA